MEYGDKEGRSVRLRLSGGQCSGFTGAGVLLRDLPPSRALMGDKGDDSNKVHTLLTEQGIAPCIPPRRNLNQETSKHRTTSPDWMPSHHEKVSHGEDLHGPAGFSGRDGDFSWRPQESPFQQRVPSSKESLPARGCTACDIRLRTCSPDASAGDPWQPATAAVPIFFPLPSSWGANLVLWL